MSLTWVTGTLRCVCRKLVRFSFSSCKSPKSTWSPILGLLCPKSKVHPLQWYVVLVLKKCEFSLLFQLKKGRIVSEVKNAEREGQKNQIMKKRV